MMVLTKSVTLLSLLVASSLGFAAPPERDFDRSKAPSVESLVESLMECLGGCVGEDCFDECVESRLVNDVQGIAQQRGAAQSSSEMVVDCLLDGLGNVGDCADIFLGADPDTEGFRICVKGAARVFLRCTGVPLESADTEEVLDRKAFFLPEQKERNFGVEVLLSAAEMAYQAFLDPDAEPFVIQISSARPTGGGIAQADPEPATFADCAGELKDNLATCERLFPEASSPGRKICDRGAESEFGGCLAE